jgi:hypothetical protein
MERAVRRPLCFLFDGTGLAKMARFHRYPSTAVANIFHGGQFVFANVLRFNGGVPAETAFGGVATRVAQVSWRIRHGTAGLARIGHNQPPFFIQISLDLLSFRKMMIEQRKVKWGAPARSFYLVMVAPSCDSIPGTSG